MVRYLGKLGRGCPAVLSSSLADELFGIFVEGNSTLLRTEVVGPAMIGRLCLGLAAVELHAAFTLAMVDRPFLARVGGTGFTALLLQD